MSSQSAPRDLVFAIDSSLFAAVPDYARSVIFAEIPEGFKAAESIERDFSDAVEAFSSMVRDTPVVDVASISRWRDAFRSAGINPSRFRPSIEALGRRAAMKDLHPLGLPLVDLGTVAALRELVPIGVHVIDHVPDGSSLLLGPAVGDEEFLLFDGTRETVQPREVIYHMGKVVLTRRWAWRQGAFGSVDLTSRWLAINVDSLGLTESQATELATRVSNVFVSSGCSVFGTIHLDRSHPSARGDVLP